MNLNPIQLWEYFVNLCKMNLHIVLCLSPIGEKLRTRLRNFPSLVSCTSPIWVQSWSESALREVAHFNLEKIAEELQLNEERVKQIAEIILKFHLSTDKMTHTYLEETKKHYYITPMSYMKLLNNF